MPCVQLASDKLGELIVTPVYKVVHRSSRSFYGTEFGGPPQRLPVCHMYDDVSCGNWTLKKVPDISSGARRLARCQGPVSRVL